MKLAAHLLAALVALEHVYFLVLEMFLWTSPLGVKTFRRSREEQEQSKVLAANQGLYNGFLVAGLVWSFFAPDMQHAIRLFFFGCVVVAGIFGGITVSKRIFYVQALPALAGLIVVALGG